MLRLWNRRRLAALSAMALGLAGASTAAWAATQDGGTDSSLATAMEAPSAPVAAVPDEVRDRFTLMRDRPATGMPADAAAMVGSSQRFGRNSALARAVDTVTGKGWVIPGDGYVCLAVKDPVDGYGVSCVPSDLAARQGVRIQLGGGSFGEQVAATVLVPDGARALLSDGSAVPTRDGVASVMTSRADDLTIEP